MNAYVIIEITGKRAERLLDRMRADGIAVYAVRRAARETLELTMPAREFSRLHVLARGSGCRIRIAEKRGESFRIRRLLQRKTLLLGLAAALACIVIASTRILFIRVSGCSRVAEQTVLRALAAEGLTVGAGNRGWDLPELNERLRTYDDRIAWIGLALDGTVLRVKVVETAVKNDAWDDDAPADVVAQKSGVITEIVATGGRASVAVGDAVEAGDVLIRGDLTREDAQLPLIVRAAGRVRAKVVYLTEAVAEPEAEVLRDSGECVAYRCIRAAGVLLFETKIPYGAYELTDVTTRTVTDLLVPLTVTDAVCWEQTMQRVRRSAAEMAEEALFQAEQSAYLKIPKDAAIVEKHSEWTEADGRVRAVVSIVTEESIGLTREWDSDRTTE